MTDQNNPPEIEDKPGLWDNALNGIILIAPWLALLALVGYVIATGQVTIGTITIAGDIPAVWVYAPVAGLVTLTYLLAIGKFYGLAPLNWLFTRAHNLAKNYNPEE